MGVPGVEPVEVNSLRLEPTLFTTQAWPSESRAMS